MATNQRMLGNKFLKNYLNNKEYGVVLNIGCRSDSDREGLCYSDYFNAKKIIKIEPNPINPIKVDYIAKCEDLPLKSSSADMVFLHNVFIPFECYVDVPKSVGEISRVLSSDGEVIISYCDFSEDAEGYLRMVRSEILKYFEAIKIYEYKTKGDRYCDKIVDYHVEIFCGKKKQKS